MAYELSILPRGDTVGAAPAAALTTPPRSPFAVPWPEVAPAIGLFAAIGASLGLFTCTSWLSDRSSFFLKNVIDASLRQLLWHSVMIGGAVAGALPVLCLLLSRGRLTQSIVRTANLACPLILVGLVPSLFAYQMWSTQPLTYLVQLGVVVLLAEHLVTRMLGEANGVFRAFSRIERLPRLRRWLPLIVVVLASIAYAVTFSYYTLLHHRRFGTAAYDLGINVNWCYNALHGNLFRSAVQFGPDGGNVLSGHAIFAMFLWLPLYAISPGAEVLLIYQSVMCGIAAIPLYLTAKELLPKSAAVVVALAYLLFAPLHGPNFYDYHELPVALPFHFLLHYSIVTRRYKLVPLFLLILYAHREDVSVGLTVLGLFMLLSGFRPKLGLVLAIVSPLVFVGIKFALMPSVGSWWFAEMYKELVPSGAQGYGPIVQTTLINPVYFLHTLLREQKLIYFLHLFAPLVFLPLRSPLLAMLSMPGFFFTLMTTSYAATLSIAFQYTTHWIPYLFLSSIFSLRRVFETFGAARLVGAVVALVLGVASHSTTFGAVIQHDTFIGGFSRIQFKESESDQRLYADFKKLIRKIPQRASVAATEREVPHVGARIDCYTLRMAHGEAEYLLIRAGEANDIVKDAFRKNPYGLVGHVGSTFYLFKQKHESTKTAWAKEKLGIP